MHDQTPAHGANHEEVNLTDPLLRTVHVLTELLEKRIDLLELDVRAAASRLAQGSALMLVGLLFALIAWVALMGLAYIILRSAYSPVVGVGGVTAINAVLALIAVLMGRAQLSRGSRPIGAQEAS